ncbi:MAG: hypothetical protein IT286_05425 [Proteobacteria bacterium]|nr:hypothetical protein [Pseudomonadota bacterium]
MKAKALLLMIIVTFSTAHAERKEKAWQCDVAVTVIRVMDNENSPREVKTESEVRITALPNVYHANIASAVNESFYQLSRETKQNAICRHSDFLRDHQDDMPTAYGYSFEEQEEHIRSFIVPLNWNSYRKRIEKIQPSSNFSAGVYQVCNYVCTSSRVDPSDKNISLR